MLVSLLAFSLICTEPSSAPVEPTSVEGSAQREYDIGTTHLQEGDILGAIRHFEQAVKADRDFVPAVKAWARTLILRAQQLNKIGDLAGERRCYRQAFELDPSLADDPAFVENYKKLNLPLVGSSSHAFGDPVLTYQPHRQGKILGLEIRSGIDTPLGIGLTGLIAQHLQLTASYETIFQAIDVDAKAIFIKTSWSPFFGVGAHLVPKPNPNASFEANSFGHFEVGVQYFAASGLYVDLGLVYAPPFARAADPMTIAFPLPMVAVGWIFQLGQ